MEINDTHGFGRAEGMDQWVKFACLVSESTGLQILSTHINAR